MGVVVPRAPLLKFLEIITGLDKLIFHSSLIVLDRSTKSFLVI